MSSSDQETGLTIGKGPEDRVLLEAILLNRIALAAAGELELDRLLDAALDQLAEVIRFTGGSIALIDGDRMVIRSARGPFAGEALGQSVARGRSPMWEVVETGEPFFTNDILATRARTRSPLRSYIAVALAWQGVASGVLEVDSTEADAFEPADVDLLKRAGLMLAGPIEIGRRQTADRVAREQLEQLAAQQREVHFRSLIENISDAILLLDTNAAVRFASPSLRRVVGVEPEEQLGRTVYDVLHPDDRERVQAALEAGWLDPHRTETFEVRVEHAEAGWRDIEATVTRVPADGTEPGLIVVLHDLTQRKEAEAALRRSEEQLRQAQKMEAIGRLAGGVAHDFNNLLTIITGQSRLVLDDAQIDDSARAAINDVLRAGEQAAVLTRQLLALGRRQVLKPQVIDLNRLVSDSETILSRLTREDIALVTDLDLGLGMVRADPGQLEQVLLNLVLNARDAMPEGGVLTLSTRNVNVVERSPLVAEGVAPGRYVALSVKDTGAGIPGDILPKIFEPFFTTKERGRGTGLGLSMVDGIVQQSEGRVRVLTRPGMGTTLQVLLPRQLQPSPAGPDAEEPWDALAGDEVVLVTEDDPGVRAFVRQVLLRKGYTVLDAASGKEALQVSADYDGTIDLLLTDAVMPGMGGRKLAKELRKLQAGLRVLYISGHGDELNRAGAEAFLPKPFSPMELTRKVRQVLDAAPEDDTPGG